MSIYLLGTVPGKPTGEDCGRRFDRPSFYGRCKSKHPAPDLAQRVVEVIRKDFTDRRGLRQSWESIDDETQDEILDKWTSLVRKEMDR